MRTQIIPAIDIIDGRCVRLSQGDYDRRRVYDASPEDMAKRYADCGVRRIHVVDLDGAKSSSPKNLKTLERMAVGVSVEIEWGGGIKSEDALRALFDYGADCAIVGSVAAREPELFIEWLLRFGGERMILGVDVRDDRVSVNGWREDLNLGVDDMVGEFLPHGVKQVVCTDISKDGMLQGPSFDLYTDLQRRYDGVDFTVSGGIGSMSDIVRLDELGLRKAIVGKAVYENRITLKDIERWSLNE
jgi:phosphoribosylformimino-5-aminoimidazole carboxamide ribotide isomerase